MYYHHFFKMKKSKFNFNLICFLHEQHQISIRDFFNFHIPCLNTFHHLALQMTTSNLKSELTLKLTLIDCLQSHHFNNFGLVNKLPISNYNPIAFFTTFESNTHLVSYSTFTISN